MLEKILSAKKSLDIKLLSEKIGFPFDAILKDVLTEEKRYVIVVTNDDLTFIRDALLITLSPEKVLFERIILSDSLIRGPIDISAAKVKANIEKNFGNCEFVSILTETCASYWTIIFVYLASIYDNLSRRIVYYFLEKLKESLGKKWIVYPQNPIIMCRYPYQNFSDKNFQYS